MILIFLDQICPKRVFLVENKKSEHHQISLRTKFYFTHIILNFATKFANEGYFLSKTKNVWVPNFTFKQTILNFETKFAQKVYFRSKTKKVNITIEFCISELVWAPNFALSWQVWFFWTKFPQKEYFWSKNPKKQNKTKNEHHHWILHIRNSVGTKFYSKQFWILGPNLPKKGIFGWKRTKWTSPLNPAYLN